MTSSTRVRADGSLYFGCLDGYFYAVNPDGSLKWKRNLREEIWFFPALLAGGKAIFIGSMAEGLANGFSLDSKTGEIIWQYQTGGPVFSFLAVTKDDKTAFVCSCYANCYAFDAQNGQKRRRFKLSVFASC